MSNKYQFDKAICVILSGGRSSRMNSHKALLPFSDEHNFLSQIVAEYRKAGLEHIVVVSNHDIPRVSLNVHANGVNVVENRSPDLGRMYSLQLGLANAPDAEYCFVQNIDNPFVNAKLITALNEVKDQARYITPCYEHKGGHPVILSAGIIAAIRGMSNYDVTLKDFLAPYSRYRLHTNDESCTININTAADYERLFTRRQTPRN